MWKYGTETIANSEFLLYSSLIEMLEFDDDVFAAGHHDHHHHYFFHGADGCQSDWLKCALKAIDHGEEAIESEPDFLGQRALNPI